MKRIWSLILLTTLTPGVSYAQLAAVSDETKMAIISRNQYDERDYHWAKLPGEQIPKVLLAYNDFVQSGNQPECYKVLVTGGNEEAYGGRTYSKVMYVDFVTKDDYRPYQGAPALKSSDRCGQPMHYSISDDGLIIHKYKPR